MPVKTSGLRTSGLRTGRLRLAPLRSRESLALDHRPQGLPPKLAGVEMAPFRRWAEFKDWFLYERENGAGEDLGWRQGDHLTAVGRTRSGKTTLIRELLPRRDFVVMLATKAEDPLYKKFEADGFEMTDHFDPTNIEGPRKVIFKPGLRGTSKADQVDQREAFREVLSDIYRTGGWTVFADEVRYLSDNLGLRADLEVLWLQGATLGITMVVATQRPVSIPILAFDANHLFFFKTGDQKDIVTMTEYTGINSDLARVTIPRLPKHEVLYIDTVTDESARTKVSL
jgi:hypothetical protein